jgi:RNA polymerase sigma-70 factor (ECF subfamily)
VTAVIETLHPDVVLTGEGGGKARTARQFVVGADNVARFSFGLLRRYSPEALASAQFVLVNGDLGMIVPALPGDAEHPALDRRVTTFAVRDGRLAALYEVVNPDKLTRVPLPG